MFPSTRAAHIALALGTLIIALVVALPRVTFRVTDLGFAYHGADLRLLGEGPRHANDSGTALHVGGCKSVGQSTICAQKEISYDHAHGLRFAASMTSQAPAGI